VLASWLAGVKLLYFWRAGEVDGVKVCIAGELVGWLAGMNKVTSHQTGELVMYY